MNNMTITNTQSFTTLDEISISWLLATAAIALIISLLEAWIATLIIYGKVNFLKRIFPAPHNLIRSHVDYTIMTALLGFTYFAVLHLELEIPKMIIVILCVGVIYNPLGFLVKAIKPNAGQSDTLAGKLAVCLGFLPATIGFGYIMFAIILALFKP